MLPTTLKINRLARLALRAPMGLGWTVGLHYSLIWLPNRLFGWKRHHDVIGLWGKGLAKIMGIRIHPRNSRSGPMGDMIIANHMGFLDIPILLSFFPSVFIIKEEMHKVPFFGKALEEEGHVFVNRADRKSGKAALRGVEEVLSEGARLIVFPEGGASPGAERRPFKPGSFAVAQRLGKTVECCVIDYLPDRKMLEWDVNRGMLPQLIDLFGRRKIDVSVEFFPAETIEGDPAEYAARWKEIVQSRLEAYDAERASREGGR